MMIGNVYIGEDFCDSWANSNLMSNFTFEELRNLKMHALYGAIGLENGYVEKT